MLLCILIGVVAWQFINLKTIPVVIRHIAKTWLEALCYNILSWSIHSLHFLIGSNDQMSFMHTECFDAPILKVKLFQANPVGQWGWLPNVKMLVWSEHAHAEAILFFTFRDAKEKRAHVCKALGGWRSDHCLAQHPLEFWLRQLVYH